VKRILLVEDDPLNIELFTTVLVDDGFEVVVEQDGATARERARAERFDLILLDLQLPRLRGDALCRELRAAGLSLPIVALTAEALPDQIRANSEAGFDDYLTKPISPAALRERVRSRVREGVS
jgi:DNA-binding response OmpR family regulator